MSSEPVATWRESLDPALVARLHRPAGVLRAATGRRILGWMGYFSGRTRPFLDLAERLGRTGALRVDDVPLVHVAPVGPVEPDRLAEGIPPSPAPAVIVVRASFSSTIRVEMPAPAAPIPAAPSLSKALVIEPPPAPSLSKAPVIEPPPAPPADAAPERDIEPPRRRRREVEEGVVTYHAPPARRVSPRGAPSLAPVTSPMEAMTRDPRPAAPVVVEAPPAPPRFTDPLPLPEAPRRRAAPWEGEESQRTDLDPGGSTLVHRDPVTVARAREQVIETRVVVGCWSSSEVAPRPVNAPDLPVVRVDLGPSHEQGESVSPPGPEAPIPLPRVAPLDPPAARHERAPLTHAGVVAEKGSPAISPGVVEDDTAAPAFTRPRAALPPRPERDHRAPARREQPGADTASRPPPEDAPRALPGREARPIDMDVLIDKVERRILRNLAAERERTRGLA